MKNPNQLANQLKTVLLQIVMIVVATAVGMPSLIAIKNPKTFILTITNSI